MNLKIIKNPNNEIYESVTQAVKDNDGYCCCLLERNSNTKCPCKDFLDQDYEGSCHCGRYIKTLSED